MSSDGADQEWMFEEDDIAQEEHAKYGPLGDPEPKQEYRIKRCLREEPSGERFYHVEIEEGGSHLFACKTLEKSYTVVSEEDSRVWPKDDGGGYFD